MQEFFPEERPLRALMDDFEDQTDILEYAGDLGFEADVEEQMVRSARLRIRKLQIYAGTEFTEVLASQAFWTPPELGRSLPEQKKVFLNDAPKVAAAAGIDELKQVRAAPSLSRLLLLSPWYTSLHDAIMVIAYFLPGVAVVSLLATVILVQRGGSKW